MNGPFTQLGFGGAALSSMKSYAEAARLLEIAYDAGIRHFDTAPSYGQGYSEVIYGKFIRNKRPDITITTKFGRGDVPVVRLPVQLTMPLNYWRKKWKNDEPHDVGEQLPVLSNWRIDRNEIEQSFKASLDRLQTDYTDYYLLHEALPDFLTDEAMTCLLDLKKSGHVRYLGIGTNITFLRPLNEDTLAHWDVLQYEGYDSEQVDLMLRKFPEKMHFHHSCLKRLHQFNQKGVEDRDKAGYLLADCSRRNSPGKIIFSTRKKAVLQQNLAAYEKLL